jgi:hypothetical protein
MSNLNATINTLRDIVGRLQTNRGQAEEHRSNEALAHTGAAAAYVLTFGTRKESVRTVGNLAALGAFLYGVSQGRKAGRLEEYNHQLAAAAMSLIESQGLPQVRSKSDPAATVCTFMELVLRLNLHVDDTLRQRGGSLRRRGMLTPGSQDFLLSAANTDLVQERLRMNRILAGIDRTKVFPDHEGAFLRAVGGIDRAKLRHHGFRMMAAIWAFLLAGVALAQVHESAAALVAAGFLLWGGNHFFPFSPDARRLRRAVEELMDGVMAQPPVYTLTAH